MIEPDQTPDATQQLQHQVYTLQGLLSVTEQQRNQAMSALAQAEVRNSVLRAELEHYSSREAQNQANTQQSLDLKAA